MKKQVVLHAICVSIIVSFLFAPASVSAGEGKPIKVFLLGGQSNMAGAGQVADLKPPYGEPFSKVRIWDSRAKKWAPLSAKVVNKKGRFGPEISFGHAIAAALPGEDIRLVKYAVGGTALHNDWAPTKGRQYVGFMNTAKAAMADLDAAGTEYEIAGMLWLQGESDAAERKAETYEKNLTAFIAHMRTQFKTPEMPFIIARVLNEYGGKTGQAKIVRDAQVKVAKKVKNVACFDTDDCPIVDPVKNKGHYNAVGLIEIGKRFVAGYKEIVARKETKKPAE